jgi:quinol monooxygenase YgiN
MKDMLALCLHHVRRSRTGPGCASHAVHVDAENPLRLFFFEEWETASRWRSTFRVPASREFVKAARALAVEFTPISIMEASPISL